MYKIAISGKANSGKNTLSNTIEKIIDRQLVGLVPEELKENPQIAVLAFADPVKEIARLMFPQISERHLWGDSKLRAEIIPGIFRNGERLTIRQLLIDIGEQAKVYNPNVWVDNLIYRYKEFCRSHNAELAIVTDVRFLNEFEALKKRGFHMIRIKRKSSLILQHVSETEQDSIPDNRFDYVLNNDGSLQDLEKEIATLIKSIQ